MKNLHYIEKILQTEIAQNNERNKNSQFDFIKNKTEKFQKGLILAGDVCKNLFFKVFNKSIYKFYACYVENDRIVLTGYRYYKNDTTFLDPYVEIDDTGVVDCSATVSNGKNEKIREYIAGQLSKEDAERYKEYINKLSASENNTYSK